MTTTLTARAEVTEYLSAVRSHLAGLAEEDRAELLEDLEAHLDEVAAEAGTTLTERLGDPAAFAAELLASAGLADAPTNSEAPRRRWRPLREVVAELPVVRAAAESASGRQVLAFLPELRPGWWVLRGYLAVMILGAVDGGAQNSFPLPGLAGSTFVGSIALGAAIAASVWWGRRSDQSPRWRRLTVAGNLAMVLLALPALSVAGDQGGDRIYSGYEPGHLSGTGGQIITDIFPYDAAGQLLRGVSLVDQQGRPVITRGYDDTQRFPLEPPPPESMAPVTTIQAPAPPSDPVVPAPPG